MHVLSLNCQGKCGSEAGIQAVLNIALEVDASWDILFLVEEVFDPLLIKMTFLNGSFILQHLNIV